VRYRLAATALALVLVLAGCGSTAPEEGGPAAGTALPDTAVARYRCSDGTRFVATFDNHAGTGTLRSGEATLGVLAQQRAASGIWYAGNGMTLRGKGRDATFSQEGQPATACRAEE
jgi:membrane-bound inhibitor of C-type lysozyme